MPEVQEPPDGPRPLYMVMACMRDIRKRSDRTDNCFNPLRDTVSTHRNVIIDQLARGGSSTAASQISLVMNRWRCCCAAVFL